MSYKAFVIYRVAHLAGIRALTACVLLLCLFLFSQSGHTQGVFTEVDKVPFAFSAAPPPSSSRPSVNRGEFSRSFVTNTMRRPDNNHFIKRSRIVKIDFRRWLLLHGQTGVQTSINIGEEDGEEENFHLPDPPPIGSMPVFNLFEDVSLTGVVEQVVPLVSGGYTMSGDISEDGLGLFSLAISGEGLISGDFITSFEKFTIRSIEGSPGYYRIIEIDPSKIPVLEDDVVILPGGEENGASLLPHRHHHRHGESSTSFLLRKQTGELPASLLLKESQPSRSSAKTTVDVMILYMAEIELQVGKAVLANKLQEVISHANQVFSSSGVHIKYRLVHHQKVDYIQQASASQDIMHLQQGYGGLKVVHNLRNTYGADLVHLILEKNTACGKAYTDLNAQHAFSISSYDCINTAGSFVLLHELGHNMGLLHNRYNERYDNSRQGIYSYNYGYINKELF